MKTFKLSKDTGGQVHGNNSLSEVQLAQKPSVKS